MARPALDPRSRRRSARRRGDPRARFARCPRRRLRAGGQSVELVVAATPLARLLGLAALDRGDAPALLIPGCRSVHSFWMRFALDIAFVVGEGEPGEEDGLEVLAVERAVAPGRFIGLPAAIHGSGRAAAVAVLELAAGGPGSAGLRPGARLALTDETGRERLLWA